MQLNESNISREELFQAAIIGYEVERQRVIDKIAELKTQLNGDGPTEGFTVSEPSEPTPPKRKHRSAAVRKRMSLAQKRSWARRRREAA